jgi:hypothetical protein
MGPASSTARAVVAAMACAAVTALPAQHGRADEAVPSPPWRLSTLTLGFADDFLGVPRTRLNDDNGFVADLRLAAELSDGERRTFRIVASEQIITERGGLNRVDDGKIYVEWLRAPGTVRGLTLGWTAGIDVIGNLGGSRLQNWAHRSIFTGRVLGGTGPNQLQDHYPGRTEVLGLVGGHARAIHRLGGGPWSLRGGVDAAIGVGTGLFAELHPFLAVGITVGPVDLELRQGAGSYWTNIRPLTMPGGYVTRLLQSQPSARLAVAGPRWLPVIFGFGLEWNSGNSSQHVGGITVGARF